MTQHAPFIFVCQLNENKIFTGMTRAFLDPLANGNKNYLYPKNSIDALEPQIKDGYAIRWTGKEWKYEEDHRNDIVFSKKTGEKQIITELGSLPNDVTPIPPIAYGVWSESKNKWVEKTNAEELRLKDRRIKAGYLTRNQLLTVLEIHRGDNKEKLVEIATSKLTGVSLIKVRNALLEAQTFTLTNDDMWQFFTEILAIDIQLLFEMWEEAQNNY